MVRRNEEAEEILRDFAGRTGITGRDLHYLGLLTEETLGMANQLLKNFEGEIWVERTAEGFDIILEAEVQGSEDGQPALAQSPTGFMAKIAEMLNCSYVFDNVEEMPEDLAETLPDYLSYGIRRNRKTPVWAGIWSLNSYRKQLQGMRKDRPEAEIQLDELEKSIVARIANEVTIGIRDRRIRLVISRRLLG